LVKGVSANKKASSGEKGVEILRADEGVTNPNKAAQKSKIKGRIIHFFKEISPCGTGAWKRVLACYS